MKPALANILANALPLAGVLFLNWDLLQVLLVFWMESAVIGVFNAGRMILINPIASVLIVPFFVVHYGGFMAGHLVFLMALFGDGGLALEGLGEQIRATLLTPWAVLTVIGFAVSHGISFVQHVIRGREYEDETIQRAMARPYRRIVAMHLAIILGALATKALNARVAPLVILVIVKSVADLRAHRREHRVV